MNDEPGNRPPALIVGPTSAGHTAIDITKPRPPSPRPTNRDHEPEITAQDTKVTVPEHKQRNRTIEHVSNTLLSALLFLLRPRVLVVLLALAAVLFTCSDYFPLAPMSGVPRGVGTGFL